MGSMYDLMITYEDKFSIHSFVTTMYKYWGRHGSHRMVVGFTTTSAISRGP